MKILAVPYNPDNPYQRLLYGAMRAQGTEVEYLKPIFGSATLDLFSFIPRIVWYRLKGYAVMHIHWVYIFVPNVFPWKTQLGSRVLFWHYIAFLRVARMLGYTIVWTAHNVIPHDPVFLDDAKARKKLAQSCDLAILHSPEALQELGEIGVRLKRFEVIPHGSYRGAYPDEVTSVVARERLGISPESFVFLYFGLIRPYKGVRDLLQAFERISDPRAVLVIAGEGQDELLNRELRDTALLSDKISFFPDRIPDAELQYYFRCADVVVLPFKRVTTSGSALLAASFDRPLIVPALGALRDMPAAAVYRYAPGNVSNLEEAMLDALHDPHIGQKAEAASAYAKEASWERIAAVTQDSIERLLDQ